MASLYESFRTPNSEGGGDDKKLLKAALSEATRTIQSRKKWK